MQVNQLMTELSSNTGMRQLVILGAAVVIALLARLLFVKVIMFVTSRTQTEIDNKIATELRRPVVWTILLVGIILAYLEFQAPAKLDFFILGILQTAIAFIWAKAFMRVGRILLEAVSENVDDISWIESRTLPLFDIILTVVVVSGFLYAVCIVWKIPLTSWLTSAGILGIAVGFAAKDTLSNLFSGIFIVADAPYQVGDFVVLDNKIRGQVLDIGMRSTRLLTRDDVEITVPNAVIANSQIINQTGGPYEKMRVRVKVQVGYGSDVDLVEQVLLGCVEGASHVSSDPAPRVRFRAFGDSGLAFELLAWIEEPVYHGRVLHQLNKRVYEAFNQHNIEIPFSKHDLYVKELPRREASANGREAT